MLKNRNVVRSERIKLLDQKSWLLISKNIQMFGEVHQQITQILHEFSEDDLAEV